MAGVKTVLKLTHTDATVKVTGTTANDTATIGVDSDLKLSSDVTTGAAWDVTIEKMLWSNSPVAGAYMTVVRNSELIAQLFSSGEMDLSAKGMADDRQSGKDIVVTFVGGSGGVIYLKFKKRTGYGD